jgi:hypothetical protein
MTWSLHRQQQQCGAQFPSGKGRRPGEAPAEATEDRAAQDHEQAGGTPQPGGYPADRIEDRDGDNTPSAPDPHADWDEVVQPERQVGEASHDFDDLLLPEGK